MPSEAKIVADSVSPHGVRLTTWLLKHQRFILAELNTHKDFSRNSASSRAIPTKRMLRLVITDPATPVRWGRYGKGMQDAGELGPVRSFFCRRIWLFGRWFAVLTCLLLHSLRLSKQVANRVLEPWLWHQTLYTATNVWNFFALRCHPAAQPEFQDLAYKMLDEYLISEPQQTGVGQWHLPFINNNDVYDAMRHNDEKIEWNFLPYNRWTPSGALVPTKEKTWNDLCLVSTARCARTSYMRAEEAKSFHDEITMADRLATAGHWSPFEHQGTPSKVSGSGRSGNFTGWTQFRKTFPTEYVSGPTRELAVRAGDRIGGRAATKLLEMAWRSNDVE